MMNFQILVLPPKINSKSLLKQILSSIKLIKANKRIKIKVIIMPNDGIFPLPKTGDEAFCPNCGEKGTIILDNSHPRLKPDNPIWWNPYEDLWQCKKCYNRRKDED